MEPSLTGLSCELQLVILDFIDGKSVVRASVAVKEWRAYALCEKFWCEKVCCELRAPILGDRWAEDDDDDEAVSSSPLKKPEKKRKELFWQAKYKTLVVPRKWRLRWRRPTTRHGLGDRVAMPQLFVGPLGRRLFCYGGWSRFGPQSDLHSAPLDELQARRPLRMSRVPETGRPCQRRGVQTLTPLWRGERGEGPSRTHFLRTTTTATTTTTAGGHDATASCSLVLAFGGAGGGYASESSDWRVGVLDEAGPSIRWLDLDATRRRVQDDDDDDDDAKDSSSSSALHKFPLARCAHTATYVPGRLLGAEHPEGAVFVVGGHADDCSRSLSEVDVLDVATWSWYRDVSVSGRKRGRHGHSAALVELEGSAFLVLIGGGTGNILHGFGAGVAEFDDCDVFNCSDKRWLGPSLPLGARAFGCVFGRHHTASPCLGDRHLLFGGGARPSNACFSFDARLAVERAALRELEGTSSSEKKNTKALLLTRVPFDEGFAEPRSRKMHAACCLLPWAPIFCVFGGWELGPHFADFCLADILPGDDDDLDDDNVLRSSFGGGAHRQLSDASNSSSSDHDHGEEEPGDYEDVVAINVATDSGTHQVRIPRSVFERLVEEGVLAASNEQHPVEQDDDDDENQDIANQDNDDEASQEEENLALTQDPAGADDTNASEADTPPPSQL
mmetsp:Transcript_4529/g.15043  ORF Transcript_4529/g.15043 Transcript_4529/m.15043 type:complete len:672 (-) Transcript_4529:381-2396(-)|eukprot:CAMPEP_0118905696 /NCGR_PEP_ID=MMETSP1166-20130328/9574_1 /TAXON_ID=1104430 /ORGANISM="Chrysoreinhardia sp, Strain CCMP3193" /LENGTH=671 /DNA_ID=CAMNT_0006844967 /DNA_START=73 /DNA_END=2088 /DNA_ORIENTATION=-